MTATIADTVVATSDEVPGVGPQVLTRLSLEFCLPRETRRLLDAHLRRSDTSLGDVVRRAIEEQLALATGGAVVSLVPRQPDPVGQLS